ncbi:hypothetical protein J2T56_000920 [Natronobacillus azotifigens]|uniref:Post-transcriptional regulator n=1 Tax=Natronobacillus azotifigens TaxID=472978 RepID=A0A9J6RAL7_9BACI|nr:post-transcriptional regulator [Natronobacillus azotifigens]MCZ0702363.1 post-transcriptional regulator [Natronobacillus azotifigens]
MKVKSVVDWKPMIAEVIQSKASELQLFGYDEATPEVVWDCLVNKVWRGTPEKRLYQVVEDVFHLNPHLFMSFITVQSYQSDDLMESIAALTQFEE